MNLSKSNLLLISVIICLVFHNSSNVVAENKDIKEISEGEEPSYSEEEGDLSFSDEEKDSSSSDDDSSISSISIDTSFECNAPLIVVSNRLPFVLYRNEKGQLIRKHSAGGLVTAVAPVVAQCNGTWIGWSGLFDLKPNEEIPESDPDDKNGLKSNQIISVHIEKSDFEEFYNGFCNGTLWPLFHSMPERAHFKLEYWLTYYKVNEKFADLTLDALKNSIKVLDDAGDHNTYPLLWIHDYQLLTTGIKIRQASEAENLRCKLGFFLHTPFPSWDISRILPWYDQVLLGLLAYDVVAFHIEDYCLNFIDSCHRQLGCPVDRISMLVQLGERTIQVKALPIGIPFDNFVKLAEKAPSSFFNMPKDVQVIVGVDRLDYTKGVVNRILSFEKLLIKYPQYLGKVVLVQISVPSRVDVEEYKSLKIAIEQHIGRINGQFSTTYWTPIKYIFKCLSQIELAAIYRDCTVAMVTPLRDGMNLVAKEFVACQIRKPGVLMLSKFAGASSTMHEALLVNPYEMDEMAGFLNQALKMSIDERKLRMEKLQAREQRNNVNYWMSSFLLSMNEEEEDPLKIIQLQLSNYNQTLSKFIEGVENLSLILDYDGTLAHYTSQPDLAKMSEGMISVLKRLAELPKIRIAIISGRTLDNLKSMVGIDKLTYVGSHGFEILHPDGTRYMYPVPRKYKKRTPRVLKLIKTLCVNGAWVEKKGLIITFNYRDVPLDNQEILKEQVKEIFQSKEYAVHQGEKAIEGTPLLNWNQGRAAIYLLRTMYGLDWSKRIRVIYVGNEEAMESLKGIAYTFRVDASAIVKTVANFRLSGPDAVLTMLDWVEKKVRGQTKTLKNPKSSIRRKQDAMLSQILHEK